MFFQNAIDHGNKFFAVQGLYKVIGGTQIHGFNSSCHLVIGADNDTFRIREFIFDAFEHIQAT